MSSAGTKTFTYDSAGRLLSVTYPSGAQTIYTYDAVGNRTSSASGTPALALSCTGGASTTMPTPATLSCTVSNTGQIAVSSISYSSIAGTTVSGPTGACGAGATCGTVTVTSATGAGTYSGTLTATPNSGAAASQAVSLTVYTPAALALSCSGGAATTSPTASVLSCAVTNNGQTGVSSISYSAIPGATVAGPTGACGANATCGTVTVTSGTTAGTYSGTLTATPNSGAAVSQSVSLTVYSPPILSLSCSGGSATTSPTASVLSCSVTNTGQTGAGSISYSAIPGTTVSGPTGACGSGAACGTVTVTSGTSAGTYAGILTATPDTGTAASKSVSLTVNSPPALGLSCSGGAPTTSPTASVLSCAVTNNGQTGVSSISYSAIPGTTVAGPTGACGANATCGTVTVTSGTGAGTYSGTLTATPNTGSSATFPVNLTVNPTPAALALQCTGGASTTAPTPATLSCTLSNTGQAGVSSISYSSIAGATVSGPTGACGGGTTCGTVTVTTGTTAGNYSGTLAVTPDTGSGTSTSVNLTVNPPPVTTTTLSANPTSVSFGYVAHNGMVTKTVTITNTGTIAATGMTYSVTQNNVSYGSLYQSGGSCGTTLGAGSSCTVNLEYDAACTNGTVSGSLKTSGGDFSMLTVSVSASTSGTGACY